MSIADELERLDALRQKGILSEEEFTAAKRNLIAPDGSTSTPFRTQFNWMHGRFPFAIGSAVMAFSLLLPWVDVALVRLSAVELVRLIFGTGDALRELFLMFDIATDTITRAEVGTLALVGVGAASLTSPLWSAPTIRNRQSLVAFGLTAALFVGGFIRYSAHEFLTIGAYLFLLASLANAAVAAAAIRDRPLRTSETRLHSAESPKDALASTAAEARGADTQTSDSVAQVASVDPRSQIVATWIEDHPVRFIASFGAVSAVVGALIFLGATSAVPDVTNQERQEALATMRSAGLRGAVSYQASRNRVDDTVMSQSPRAGSRARRGSEVNLRVARLPRFTIEGVLIVVDGGVGPDGTCVGPRSDGTLRSGYPIFVLGQAGEVLGEGNLASEALDDENNCVLRYRMSDIKQSESYTIKFGDEARFTYTHHEMTTFNALSSAPQVWWLGFAVERNTDLILESRGNRRAN